MSNSWGMYTLITETPTYLNNIQHISLKAVRIEDYILFACGLEFHFFIEWTSICFALFLDVVKFNALELHCRQIDNKECVFCGNYKENVQHNRFVLFVIFWIKDALWHHDLWGWAFRFVFLKCGQSYYCFCCTLDVYLAHKYRNIHSIVAIPLYFILQYFNVPSTLKSFQIGQRY